MNEDIKLIESCTSEINLTRTYQLYKKSLQTKKISYITHLLSIQDIIKKEIMNGTQIKLINKILSGMNLELLEEAEASLEKFELYSTMQIINYTDRAFKDLKIRNNEVLNIRNILNKRTDLFAEFVKYTKNTTNYYNDLYFWHPDLEISDIYTFLLSCFDTNALICLYKEYLKENIVLRTEYYTGLHVLLEERYTSPVFSYIEVIKRDQKLFPVSVHSKVVKRVVSHEYWVDRAVECKNVVKKLIEDGYIKKRIEKEEIEEEFQAGLSYAEISIKNNSEVTLIVSIEKLEDLMTGTRKFRSFWMSHGIINSEGDYII